MACSIITMRYCHRKGDVNNATTSIRFLALILIIKLPFSLFLKREMTRKLQKISDTEGKCIRLRILVLVTTQIQEKKYSTQNSKSIKRSVDEVENTVVKIFITYPFMPSIDENGCDLQTVFWLYLSGSLTKHDRKHRIQMSVFSANRNLIDLVCTPFGMVTWACCNMAHLISNLYPRRIESKQYVQIRAIDFVPRAHDRLETTTLENKT